MGGGGGGGQNQGIGCITVFETRNSPTYTPNKLIVRNSVHVSLVPVNFVENSIMDGCGW